MVPDQLLVKTSVLCSEGEKTKAIAAGFDEFPKECDIFCALSAPGRSMTFPGRLGWKCWSTLRPRKRR